MSVHEFFLISVSDEQVFNDWVELAGILIDGRRSDLVQTYGHAYLSDELVLYIFDSFSWLVPDYDDNNVGLDYHGVNIIGPSEREKFYSILLGWINIFSVAPDPINLTGRYPTFEGSKPPIYKKMLLDKQEVLDSLLSLLSLVCRLDDTSSKYIVYCGI